MVFIDHCKCFVSISNVGFFNNTVWKCLSYEKYTIFLVQHATVLNVFF